MVVSGMTDTQIRKCHERLERFLVDLLEPVGRSERRHWGAVYVRGLLLDGERKSVEPMASRLPDGNVQAMQQFIGQSPWDWPPIWERLARRMTAELEPESAWAIDDTGFPKQGDHSVGVERQYSGTLGKTGNCQVAVSLHHVGAKGSAALNWRLYLPERHADHLQPRVVDFDVFPDRFVVPQQIDFCGFTQHANRSRCGVLVIGEEPSLHQLQTVDFHEIGQHADQLRLLLAGLGQQLLRFEALARGNRH